MLAAPCIAVYGGVVNLRFAFFERVDFSDRRRIILRNRPQHPFALCRDRLNGFRFLRRDRFHRAGNRLVDALLCLRDVRFRCRRSLLALRCRRLCAVCALCAPCRLRRALLRQRCGNRRRAFRALCRLLRFSRRCACFCRLRRTACRLCRTFLRLLRFSRRAALAALCRFLGFFRCRLCALRAGCAHRRLCRRVRRLPDAFHGSLLGFARRFLRNAARQSLQLFRRKVRIGECVALVPFFALLAAKIPNLQFDFFAHLLSPIAGSTHRTPGSIGVIISLYSVTFPLPSSFASSAKRMSQT